MNLSNLCSERNKREQKTHFDHHQNRFQSERCGFASLYLLQPYDVQINIFVVFTIQIFFVWQNLNLLLWGIPLLWKTIRATGRKDINFLEILTFISDLWRFFSKVWLKYQKFDIIRILTLISDLWLFFSNCLISYFFTLSQYFDFNLRNLTIF